MLDFKDSPLSSESNRLIFKQNSHKIKKRVEQEKLITEANDLIGNVGGILGLWVGFSVFNVFEILLDFFYTEYLVGIH